jgi:hypothetical protein
MFKNLSLKRYLDLLKKDIVLESQNKLLFNENNSEFVELLYYPLSVAWKISYSQYFKSSKYLFLF